MKLASSPFVLRKTVSILAIVILGVTLLLSFAPIVHAANPTMTNLTSGSGCSAATCTQTPTLTAGTTVVVVAGIISTGNGAGSAGITVASVTDTAGLTYAKAFAGLTPAPLTASGSSPVDDEVWYATTGTSSGADTITVTLTASPYEVFLHVNQVSVPILSTTLPSAFVQFTSQGACSSCTVQLTQTVQTPVSAGSIVFLVNYATSCPNSASCSSGSTSGGAAGSPVWTSSTGANPTALLTQWGFSTTNKQAQGGDDAFLYYSAAASVTYSVQASSNANEFLANALVVVVFSPFSSGSSSNTQIIGSCGKASPAATFTPVNSTMYVYSGNALGSEVVNTIFTGTGTVTGTAGVARSLQLLIYATATNGPVTPTNALNQVYSKSFTLTGGTTATNITLQVSIQLNAAVFPFQIGNTWLVGLVADSHIPIQTSSTSGLTTLAANAAGTTQPNSFTNLGTSVGTKLMLCATGLWQTFITQVTTTTAAASTTTTISTTTTLSTLNLQAATQDSTTFTIMLLVILLPAMVMMGATAVATHNGVATTVAFVGGLGIGAALGFQAGLVPFSIVAILVLVMIFMVMGVFMLSRSGGGG